MGLDIQEAHDLAQHSMSEKRFRHTLGVVENARELAVRHGLDIEKAQIAGYLHDLKKEVPLPQQVDMARRWKLLKYPEDEAAPYVLHGPLAAYWLEHEYGYKDSEVLAAIAQHTLGAPGMGKLEMLIYSADLTEPNRVFPKVDKLRQSLYDNLEAGTLLCVEHTLEYLKSNNLKIHPLTQLTYEDLKRRQKFANG
jgi:predicted HD superfamily hydrolase involved in NAD metabolism